MSGGVRGAVAARGGRPAGGRGFHRRRFACGAASGYRLPPVTELDTDIIVRIAANGDGMTANGRPVPLAAPGHRIAPGGGILPGSPHADPERKSDAKEKRVVVRVNVVGGQTIIK